MFKFFKARHKKSYISLGWKYKVWPERVYRLAHGKHAHSHKDHQITHELLALGIIHRHTETNFDGSTTSNSSSK